MYDIDDGTRSNCFEVFEEDSGVASISCLVSLSRIDQMRELTIWGIDTFRREVCQLLEVCVPGMSKRPLFTIVSQTYITISFSYAYLNGFDRLILSSLCVVVTAVHRLKRAISPRMTIISFKSACLPELTNCSSIPSRLYHPHYVLSRCGRLVIARLLCLKPVFERHHRTCLLSALK